MFAASIDYRELFQDNIRKSEPPGWRLESGVMLNSRKACSSG